MVNVLPVALESPVPAPVGVSNVGLYVNVKTTSVAPDAARQAYSHSASVGKR
jgi:hypothetical protein